MKKTIDDINLDQVDLSKHLKIIKAGSVWYRIVDKGRDPLIPTGIKSRFSKEPPGFSPEKYKIAWDAGCSIHIGTGSTCFCQSINTAKKETGENLGGKEIYRITLTYDIEVVDIDSICKAEEISKPYITEERKEFWHNFYGKKVKGLIHESSKNPRDYNLVIFQDLFQTFKELVAVEKVEY